MIGFEKELIRDNDNLIEFGVKASIEYLKTLKENGKEVPCLSESKYTLSEKCNECIFLRKKIIIDPAEVYVSSADLGDEALYLFPEMHEKRYDENESVKDVKRFAYCPVSEKQPMIFGLPQFGEITEDEFKSIPQFGKFEGENEESVYKIVKENPGIEITDIELKTQKTYPALYRLLRSLEIKNKIKGKWEEKNKKTFWPIEESKPKSKT